MIISSADLGLEDETEKVFAVWEFFWSAVWRSCPPPSALRAESREQAQTSRPTRVSCPINGSRVASRASIGFRTSSFTLARNLRTLT